MVVVYMCMYVGYLLHVLCPQALDESPDLQLLLSVTDLLASCSEGENLFIESVCQTIYKVDSMFCATLVHLYILAAHFLSG